METVLSSCNPPSKMVWLVSIQNQYIITMRIPQTGKSSALSALSIQEVPDVRKAGWEVLLRITSRLGDCMSTSQRNVIGSIWTNLGMLIVPHHLPLPSPSAWISQIWKSTSRHRLGLSRPQAPTHVALFCGLVIYMDLPMRQVPATQLFGTTRLGDVHHHVGQGNGEGLQDIFRATRPWTFRTFWMTSS